MKRGVIAIILVSFILLQTGNNSEIYSLENERDVITKQLDQGQQDENSTISLEILMIGNSYTSSNTLNQKLERLLDDSGIVSDVESVTGGGMVLSDHAVDSEEQGNQLNVKLSERQDFVILQDQSQVPSFSSDSSYWIDSN